jgi:hypothetical protein
MPSVVLPFPSPCEPDCRPRPTSAARFRGLTTAWWDGWVRYAADPASWRWR